MANGCAYSFSVLGAESDAVVDTIPAGDRVWGTGLSSVMGKLYAADGLSDDVTVTDTVTGDTITTIPIGRDPWGVAVRE